MSLSISRREKVVVNMALIPFVINEKRANRLFKRLALRAAKKADGFFRPSACFAFLFSFVGSSLYRVGFSAFGIYKNIL